MLTSRSRACAQAFYLQQQAAAALGAAADQVPGLKLHYYPNLTQNSGESEETKRCDPRARLSWTAAAHAAVATRSKK